MLPLLQCELFKVCVTFAAMRTSFWPGLSSRTPGRCTRSACTPAPRPRSASTPRSPRTSSPPSSDHWIAICSSLWAFLSQRSSAQPSSPSPSTMSSIRLDNIYCSVWTLPTDFLNLHSILIFSLGQAIGPGDWNTGYRVCSPEIRLSAVSNSVHHPYI